MTVNQTRGIPAERAGGNNGGDFSGKMQRHQSSSCTQLGAWLPMLTCCIGRPAWLLLAGFSEDPATVLEWFVTDDYERTKAKRLTGASAIPIECQICQ